MAGLPHAPWFRTTAVAIVVCAPLLVAAELVDGPPPVTIGVEGSVAMMPAHATLGKAIRAFSLHPVAGRLLDVEGDVLDPRAEPGAVLLNGAPATRATRLTDGDSITVVDGTDRTEGTKRVVDLLPGRQAGNPMFTLATSRMEEIRTVGRISGKVVSVRYRSIGKETTEPTVALTFDDGPWPRSTKQVLGVLERFHVKATFFMVGYLIERYPQIVRAVERAGMEIGTHSWSHPYQTPFVDLTEHRIQTEIARPADLLRRSFGIVPTAFRPPGGTSNDEVVALARTEGMRVVRWSVDPADYTSGATPRSIARDVLGSVRPGSIVLLHDGGGDRSATIRALPQIIRGIRHRGLRFVTIP